MERMWCKEGRGLSKRQVNVGGVCVQQGLMGRVLVSGQFVEEGLNTRDVKWLGFG